LASIAYSRWLSKGAFSLSNRIAVVFFGFLNIFFMVRMMPKSEIGIWVLFTSVTAILEMVRNGFIRNPFVAHLVTAEDKDKKSVVTASLALHCILGIVVSILLLLGAFPLAKFWDAPGLDRLFLLYSLNNIIFIPFLHFEYLQTAKSNFKAIFISNFCRLAIFGGYIMAVYFLDQKPSLAELAIVQIVATAIATLVSYQFVKGFRSLITKVDKKLIKELFHFGKYTFGTNISSMFVKSTDSWMIGRLISTAGVAIYNPAIRIANLVEVPTLAIASIVFPQVPQKMKERGNEGVRDIYTKSVSLILACMIPLILPLYIYAEEIITVIFGADYVDSAPILRVTIFYTLIIPFNRQFGTVMDSLKHPKINFYLLVMVAVLNVVFNYIFLNMFGLIGSAYGTLLSYCVVFVLNQIILYRMYHISTWKVFEGIFSWYKIGWNMFRSRIINVA
jgi:O-antigen/teichoic acid export membrane protein